MSTINDDPILNLARVIARYHKLHTVPEISSVARALLADWVSFQDKEYLDDQDNDVPEKRIYILLDLLVHTTTCGEQRKGILKLLADNVDAYACVCANCPSGAFSKTLWTDVIDILEPVYKNN